MDDYYSKQSMLNALCSYLKKNKFILFDSYDPIFDPARVPIYGYKYIKGERKEIFVDLITENHLKPGYYFDTINFPRGFKWPKVVDASSAQFYRHFFPNSLVYWAIPGNCIKDSYYDSFKSKCETSHIGIYQVNITKGKPTKVKEIVRPDYCLNDQRLYEICDNIESTCNIKINDSGKKDLYATLCKQSEYNLSYLVFYPEPIFTKSDISSRDETKRISTELVNKNIDLNNISYRSIITEFSNKYYKKTESDYDTARMYIKRIWDEYNIGFPDLHNRFEGILKLNPRYRDHFLHAFQVFLYGGYIIDRLYPYLNKNGFGNEHGKRLEDAWAIASTYHDFNYMVQMFEGWTGNFFKESMYLEEENPATLNLWKPYVKEGYMFNTKKLIQSIGIHDVDKVLLDYLYDRILTTKNHGIISALSLMKYTDINNNSHLNRHVISVASKAIALHDYGVWGYLSGIAEGKNKDKIGNAMRDKKILKEISISKDPIPFILILSDSIQEEGRIENISDKHKAKLEVIDYKKDKIYTEISFNDKKSFEKKEKELNSVKKFLRGDNKFKIVIKNKSIKHHRGVTFII